MAQIDSTGYSLFKQLVHFFYSCENHPLTKFTLTHIEKFDGLYKIITEVIIKTTFYTLQFSLIFLRKTVLEVLPYNLMTILYYLHYQKIKTVRKNIKSTQR